MQFLPGGLLLLFTPFLVESHRWLMSRHRHEQALKNLKYLRNLPANHPYLLEEIEMVDASLRVEEQKTTGGLWSNFKELMSYKYRGRMGMCLMLAIFQNLTGINAINVCAFSHMATDIALMQDFWQYYSPTVFRQLGITGTNTGLLTTGIFGILKCSASLAWCFFLIDNVGRRPLFLIGSAGAAITMCIITALLQTNHPVAGAPLSSKSIAAVAFLYIWTLFYVSHRSCLSFINNSDGPFVFRAPPGMEDPG